MIGYYLLTQMSDRVRLVVGCALFDLSIAGCVFTLIFTNEPKWILALSWGALTLTAADILSTALVLVRQKEGRD